MYWLPPALATPKHSRQFAADHNTWANQGATWFWRKRLLVLDENNPNPNCISEQELNCIRKFTVVEKPKHIQSTTIVENGKSQYKGVCPIYDIDDEFRIMDVPFLASDDMFGIDSKRHILLLKRDGENWSFYPRAFLHNNKKPGLKAIISGVKTEKLTEEWKMCFENLPRFCATIDQKMQGLPYLAGTIANEEYSQSKTHQTITHLANCILSASILLEIAPPIHIHENKNKLVFTTYQEYQLRNSQKQTKETIVHLIHTSFPNDAEIAKRREIINSILIEILSKHNEDVPFLFEKMEITNFLSSKETDKFSGNLNHWTPGQKAWRVPLPDTYADSLHNAFNLLTTLPSFWQDIILRHTTLNMAKSA